MADVTTLRAELEQRRDRARETIAGLAKRPERGTAQGFGKRIGDGTVEAISRLTEIGVGTSLELGLERTERALAKLDDGTYGLCDTCGKPIAPKRLQAMPDVVLCIECAAAQPRAVAPLRRQLGGPARGQTLSHASMISTTWRWSVPQQPPSS